MRPRRRIVTRGGAGGSALPTLAAADVGHIGICEPRARSSRLRFTPNWVTAATSVCHMPFTLTAIPFFTRIWPKSFPIQSAAPCYTGLCRCAQRRGGIIQVGWQPGKPDLTNRAKGADFTTRHCQTRRAGCVETRLSGSMEACWRNPPDLSSGRVRRVIPAFYPIAIALKQGDADMPRWNSWQRLGHRGCVDLRRCAANFGRPKLRSKSAQGVRDYRVQAPGPFNLRWRGECPSW
jgi:hypothetical protein